MAFDGEQLPLVGHAFQAVRAMVDEGDFHLRAGPSYKPLFVGELAVGAATPARVGAA